MTTTQKDRCAYCGKIFRSKDIVSDNINSRYRRVHKSCREEINKGESKVTYD